MSAETILIAEDDAASRALIRELVTRAGYRAVEAENGRAALVAIERETPDLVLLDVRMPALDGIELTRRLRAAPATALLPIILVTGLAALEDKVAGLEAGATDFLAKPFEAPELIARVRAALRTKSLTDRLESTQAVLVSLANAVEAKDPTTEHHCNRLVSLAIGIAREAGLDEAAIESVGYGAALHDVGKIGVSEALLRKPSGLSPEEWVEIRRHPEVGARIVEPLRLGTTVAPIVRAHHERWDGSGYPHGLRGTDIPLGARIVSIVDAYDAMTHDRPYRRGRPVAEAIAELRRFAGQQFDPDLVRLFVARQDRLATEGEVPNELMTRGLARFES